mgnify:CR=1 FL=1
MRKANRLCEYNNKYCKTNPGCFLFFIKCFKTMFCKLYLEYLVYLFLFGWQLLTVANVY